MRIPKGATYRANVVLINNTGAPVTGAVAADFAGSAVTVVKGDGTTTTIALVLSTNLFEIGSGLYQIIVPNTATTVVGSFALIVNPAASLFVGDIINGDVVDTAAEVLTAIIANYTGTTGSVGNLLRLMRAIFAGLVKIDSVLGTLKVTDTDGTTLLQTQSLFRSDGTTPAGLDAVWRALASPLP